MKGAQILLHMLKLHEIKHVFGLPGETTLGLYREWLKCPGITHILTHDERSAAFMAEAYAKVTGKVGVSEAPSPGAGHPVPGVIESFTGSVPTLCLTSDVPFNSDKKNMLSGFDQNSLYSAITKESILVTRAKDLPFLIRRAFRVAVSGRPGAVHMRIPMDVYEEEAEVSDLYPDPCMARWPYQRPIADLKQVVKAIELLAAAKRPVIVCGQGALVSDAGDEVAALAEMLNIPVGCTMTGKGTISERHPLSIRLVGARGGDQLFQQVPSDRGSRIFYRLQYRFSGDRRLEAAPFCSGTKDHKPQHRRRGRIEQLQNRSSHGRRRKGHTELHAPKDK